MAIHVSKKLFPEEILMKDKIFGVLQRIGRSFMLPIAMVPPMWQDSWFPVDRIFSLPSWRILLISPHLSADATRYFSGEFIFMIFGLPGAALAMYRCAKPGRKKTAVALL